MNKTHFDKKDIPGLYNGAEKTISSHAYGDKKVTSHIG